MQPDWLSALHAVLDPMPKALAVVSRDGKVLFANPAAEASLGLDDPQGPSSALLDRLVRGEVADGQEVFVVSTKTQERRWLNFRIWPLVENGAVSGSVIFARDTTDTKRATEMRDRGIANGATRATNESLGRMSRQLRAHLNSILGFAQMLAVAQLGPQQRNNVQSILAGGYHVLDLINELADLAKIEPLGLGISPEPVRIKEALKNALKSLQPLIAERSVTVRLDIEACLDSHVRVDRRRLRQALSELLSHVIRASPREGTVSLSCYETPGNRVHIEISGTGLRAEDCSRSPTELLPMDLANLDESQPDLRLTQRLLQAMGVGIALENAGAGYRLSLEFFLLDDPLERLEGDSAAMRAFVHGARAAQQGVVLYVEDNPANLQLIEHILAFRPGIELLKAMDAKSGIELAETRAPNWILLDLNLPDMAGEMVVRHLREGGHTSRIPITVLSGDAAPDTIRRIIAAGARDYLTKPLDIQKLLALLDDTFCTRLVPQP